MNSQSADARPMENLEQWDDFLKGRYRPGKSESEFRQYDAQANPGVAEFYRLNHENQTVDYVVRKEKEYFGLKRARQSVWEAAEFLNSLVDDSDPDTDLSQIEHLLQTSEAIRRDGHPRWMVLAGFIHDLGKVLCLYGEPQWGVVGDTFPSAAPGQTRLCSPSTSATIRTRACRNIKPSSACTNQTVAWRTCTCRSDTTATSPRS